MPTIEKQVENLRLSTYKYVKDIYARLGLLTDRVKKLEERSV